MIAKRVALVLAAVLLLALAASFFVRPKPLKIEKNEYYLYASSYPAYAVSCLITRDVPGMHLRQLTQPQYEGYSQYTLSDWEKAILEHADVMIFMGFGFEGFADYTTDKAAVITLLSLLGLQGVPENCQVLDYRRESGQNTGSPYLYMSADGMMQLLEVMYGNMALLDPEYGSLYRENYDAACKLMQPLQERTKAIGVLSGKRIAVMHEALLYTACDMKADIALVIKRDTAQDLDEEETELSIAAAMQNNVEVLLIEKQADDTVKNAFRKAGITVIEIELMCDMSDEYGYQGYIDAYERNLNAIEEAFRE